MPSKKTIKNGLRKIDCPKPDDPVYKKTWRQITDDLVFRDNFKSSHYRIIERICELTSKLKKVEEELDIEGWVLEYTYQGQSLTKANPKVQIYNLFLNQLKKWEAHAGITPYKDAKLKEQDSDEKSPWDIQSKEL